MSSPLLALAHLPLIGFLPVLSCWRQPICPLSAFYLSFLNNATAVRSAILQSSEPHAHTEGSDQWDHHTPPFGTSAPPRSCPPNCSAPHATASLRARPPDSPDVSFPFPLCWWCLQCVSNTSLMILQCFANVSHVFRQCLSIVFPMCLQCFSSVSQMFLYCFSGVSLVFLQCFSSASQVLLKYFSSTSQVLLKYFSSTSPVCLHCVSTVSPVCLHCLSSVLQCMWFS